MREVNTNHEPMLNLAQGDGNWSAGHHSDKPSPRVGLTLEAFPELLKRELLFATWVYELDAQGRWTKVSYNPRTGGKAMPNKPVTFADLNTALDAYSVRGHDGITAGIFKGCGNNACIDVDHCIDAVTGEMSDLARLVLAMLPGTYWELSPSGGGIHVWVHVPSLVAKYGHDVYRAKFYVNHAGLEAYTSQMTNHVISVTGAGHGEFGSDRSDQYEALLEKLMLKPRRTTRSMMHPTAPLEVSDQQLLALAMHAKNGAKFTALWNGDTSIYRTSDSYGRINEGHSEADLALCTMLAFWTQRDRDRIDRLFRMSGLCRPKWDRDDYRAWTLDKAIEGCSEVYCGKSLRNVSLTGDSEVADA